MLAARLTSPKPRPHVLSVTHAGSRILRIVAFLVLLVWLAFAFRLINWPT